MKKIFYLVGVAIFIIGGFFVTAHSAFAVASIISATGGSAISADTVGGNYTTLIGPVLAESADNQIKDGTITLTAPTGFEFDSSVPATVTLTGNADYTKNINDLASGTVVNVTPTASQITFTVSTQSASSANTLTYGNIRVRPTAGTPLASGNLVLSSTGMVLTAVDAVSLLPANAGALAEIAGTHVYTQTDFTAFDGVGITPVGTNYYTISHDITATYPASNTIKLTGYAPIVTPWFGLSWTGHNYVTVGIKLPTNFAGTTVYQTGIMRYDVVTAGEYKMSSVGDGSTPLATTGAALGYLDYSFAADSTNTKNAAGLVKLEVIWTQGGTPEYFTIDVSGLQLAPSNLTAYNTAIAAVTQTDYTTASWTTYQLVVTANARTVEDSQTAVDAATGLITTAQGSLVFAGEADLATAETLAGTKVPASYTIVTWTALTNALALPHSTNTEIVNKTTAINNAITGLVLKADLTAYNTAIAAVTQTDYTTASWTTYQLVVTANARTVEDSQTAVDASTGLITTAQIALVPQYHRSGSYTIPAVPANITTPDGCAPGDKFSTTTGRNCNAATPAVSAGQVLGAEKFNFTLFLKFKPGSYKFSLQGTEVMELQKLLTSLGYDLGIADGKFGPKTKAAVIKFQLANKLVGDGIVGALTRAVLNK